MSIPLYGPAGLRFWSERELELRDTFVTHLHRSVSDALRLVNRAWAFERCEGPTLTPRGFVAPGYDADDLWLTQAPMMGEPATLRPETTPSTYAYAKHRLGRSVKALPACFWQVGKSYRRELNDGATASRMRYKEFTQAEWQCIYRADTLADYRAAVLPAVADTVAWVTRKQVRVVPSDRLPAYSQRTDDIEVLRDGGDWIEMCSVSTRTDYAPDLLVLEIAVGLDRLVEVAA